MKNDDFGRQIKDVLVEETEQIKMSNHLRDSILQNRKKTLKDKIIDFLNREVEVPLVPMVASFVIVVFLMAFPREILDINNTRIVEGSSFNIIFRNEGVSMKYED